MGDRHYSTSTALLEALAEAGISSMFASLGSDHPGLIEAGRGRRLPPRRLTPGRTQSSCRGTRAVPSCTACRAQGKLGLRPRKQFPGWIMKSRNA